MTDDLAQLEQMIEEAPGEDLAPPTPARGRRAARQMTLKIFFEDLLRQAGHRRRQRKAIRQIRASHTSRYNQYLYNIERDRA